MTAKSGVITRKHRVPVTSTPRKCITKRCATSLSSDARHILLSGIEKSANIGSGCGGSTRSVQHLPLIWRTFDSLDSCWWQLNTTYGMLEVFCWSTMSSTRRKRIQGSAWICLQQETPCWEKLRHDSISSSLSHLNRPAPSYRRHLLSSCCLGQTAGGGEP